MVRIKQTNLACAGVGRCTRRAGRRSFTLVEMVVAIAVIIILVTIVLPAANALWAQRKTAEAQNTIQGLLMTARARALRASQAQSAEFRYYVDGNEVPNQAGGGETGLLFFVDEDGVQRIAPIAQVNAGDVAWQSVFGITPDRSLALPEPMRVVPRYVVEEPNSTNAPETFSEVELENDDFGEPVGDFDEAQRHRNYFTMIFSDEGHLLTWRDVLIYDEDADGNEFGDRTHLAVSDGPGGPDGAGGSTGGPNVTQYYRWQDGSEEDIDPTDPATVIPYLVYDTSNDVALNLPSVDGLLVYDDSLFSGFTKAEDKRSFLLMSAQPFYVNRLTGAVIRGPLGENVDP